MAAFSSGPVLGAIGWLSEDDLHLPHAPRAPKSPFAGLSRPDRLAKIALAEVGMGEPEETLDLIAGSGFSGAVVSGVGGGHVPEHLAPAVARLAEVMPVVLASRTGSGASLKRTYGYLGGADWSARDRTHPGRDPRCQEGEDRPHPGTEPRPRPG